MKSIFSVEINDANYSHGSYTWSSLWPKFNKNIQPISLATMMLGIRGYREWIYFHDMLFN